MAADLCDIRYISHEYSETCRSIHMNSEAAGTEPGSPVRLESSALAFGAPLTPVGLPRKDAAAESKSRTRIRTFTIVCIAPSSALADDGRTSTASRAPEGSGRGVGRRTRCAPTGCRTRNRPQVGAKLLQKTLDRRHKPALTRFAKAKGPEGVLALWDDAVKSGDIPGAYWAAPLIPPPPKLSSSAVRGSAYALPPRGSCQPCGHPAARELEEERATLAATVERQNAFYATVSSHATRPFGVSMMRLRARRARTCPPSKSTAKHKIAGSPADRGKG